MTEVRPLGEESADLELGVLALADPTEQLQHEPIPVGHRGVALIAPSELGVERTGPSELREALGTRSRQAETLAAGDAPPLDQLVEGRRDADVAEPVHEEPRAVTGLHPSHDVFRPDVVTLAPADERQGVRGGLAFGERHVDEGDEARVPVPRTAEPDRIGDLRRRDPTSLGTEPSLALQIARDRALEVPAP